MLLVLALTAVLASSVFGDSCESHNHPQYGKVGRCISTSNCANGLYISGLCESHGGDVKCCFSPSSSGSNSQLDYSGAVYIQSPHHNKGRSGNAISCLVLHGTAGGGTVEWFQNPTSKVSTHYVVEMSGRVVQMVDESDTAWHNGHTSSNSALAGRPNGNLWCIGIEFSRNVANDNIMPEVQVAAGVKLVADIKRRHKGITIYTHDQFSIGRTCPGPNFPLSRFKSA